MSFAQFFYANENNILALVLFAVIAAFVYIKRRNFTVEGKIVFIYKTKIGLRIMKRLSRFKRAINVYGILGALSFFASTAFMLYLLVPYMGLFLSHPSTTPAAVQLVLPVSGVPDVIGVPILYWLIAIIVVVVFHEASHGIVALSKKVRVKSSGFGFFLAFLPLAFVEPDEKQFAKIKRFDRIKVLAAGSFTNILMGIAFLAIYILLSNYIISAGIVTFPPIYLHILSVVPSGPAALAGLTANTTVTEINGNHFSSPQQAVSYLSVQPGQYVNLTALDGTVYHIKTAYNSTIPTSTHSYIGITGEYVEPARSPFIISPLGNAIATSGFAAQSLYWVDGLMFWLFLISLGIGTANFLPIGYITDGCKIVYELLGYVSKDKKKVLKATNAIVVAFTVFILFLLIMPLILR